MEKLSSILPKSPRTQNVDNSKAQPARPGAPLLGRPMGKSTQSKVFESQQLEAEIPTRMTPDLSFAEKFSVDPTEDRISLSGDTTPEDKMTSYNRKGEMQKVKIADDVSRKFYALNVAADKEPALGADDVAGTADSIPTMQA